MSNVTYQVEVQYLSSGSLGLDKVGAQVGSVNTSISGLLGKFASIGQSASDSFLGAMLKMEALKLTMEGVGAVIGFVSGGITGIQQEMENAGIAFAGMFQASGRAGSLKEGLEQSQAVLQLMRQDARELPGEFTDIVEIFQLMGQTAFRSGMSIRGVEKLAAKTMAFGATFGINNNIAGREMSAMIAGSAQGRMPLFQKLLGGMEAKVFNAKPLQERLRMIEEAYTKYDDSMKMHVDSWKGLTSTLHDNMETIIRSPLTQSLFTDVKGVLKDINNWFTDNREVITSWAQKIGDELSKAFTSVMPDILNVGKFIKKHFGDTPAQAITNSKKLLAGGASLGIGAAAGGAIGALLGGTAGAIGGLVAGPAGAAAGGAAGAAGGALAGVALATMIMGAFNALIDGASYFHDYAIGLVQRIKDNFSSLFTELTRLWDNLKEPVQNIVEALGVTFLEGLKKVSDVAVSFLKMVNDLLERPEVQLMIGKFGVLGGRKTMPPQGPTLEKAFSPFGYYPDIDRKGDAKITPPAHNTYINRVEIQVNSNQDPSRIARLTVEELVKLAANPKSAGKSGIPRFSTSNY